jgi:hypothetical protein
LGKRSWFWKISKKRRKKMLGGEKSNVIRILLDFASIILMPCNHWMRGGSRKSRCSVSRDIQVGRRLRCSNRGGNMLQPRW